MEEQNATAWTERALRGALCAFAFSAAALPPMAIGQIQFQDITESAGIAYTGESWGASWGDFNGDGLADIWASNHGPLAGLWLNNGDATFTNISQQVLPDAIQNGPVADEHGAAWVDFDNDGDQDIFQAVAGGSQDQPNRMYINSGGLLIEQAAELKLALPEGRSRTPLWFDQDNNGLLDVMISTATSNGQLLQAPSLNLQFAGGFVNVTESLQLNLEETTLMVLHSDVAGDAAREILVGATSRSLRAYEAHNIPFSDISNAIGLGTPKGMNDAVAADLTGNLVPDIYMVEGEFGQDVVQNDSVTVEAHLSPRNAEEGFSFVTTGDVTFDLYPVFNVNPNQVFIGASGFNPESRTFTLSPADVSVHGTPTYTPGTDTGFFVSYDPPTQAWSIVLSHLGFMERNVVVTAQNAITDLQPIGFNLVPTQDADNYLVRDGAGVYREEGPARGIAQASFGRNIGVGDFDNDMDLDLYIVATGPVTNLPNVLYENDGAGNFTAVADAGGAAGVSEGRGDAVAVADFDEDGYLDLFVTNGSSKPPFDADGPYLLFQNTGSGNHWLEIDLEGVVSNRDGIGARIVATSGGISQLREYGNDMHFRAQNHRRAHFGLAGNEQVDELTVQWPSGITQTIAGLPADQRIRLVEPVTATVVGKPKYKAGVHDGVFAWFDAAAGLYRVRASGGDNVSFHIRVLSDNLLGNVTPVKIGRNDRLTLSPYGIDAQITVNHSENGVDFQLAPGARALLSVEREGITNPRLLTVGAENGRLPPAGWILPSAQLPSLPAFVPGVDMGLHLGTGPIATDLQARWTGSEFAHDGHLVVLAGEAFGQITPVFLEPNDTLITGANFVDVDGGVTAGQDGIDLQLSSDALIGVSYLHDGLFQSHRVNAGSFAGGQPNAFWLPAAPAAVRHADHDPDARNKLRGNGREQRRDATQQH